MDPRSSHAGWCAREPGLLFQSRCSRPEEEGQTDAVASASSLLAPTPPSQRLKDWVACWTLDTHIFSGREGEGFRIGVRRFKRREGD